MAEGEFCVIFLFKYVPDRVGYGNSDWDLACRLRPESDVRCTLTSRPTSRFFALSILKQLFLSLLLANSSSSKSNIFSWTCSFQLSFASLLFWIAQGCAGVAQELRSYACKHVVAHWRRFVALPIAGLLRLAQLSYVALAERSSCASLALIGVPWLALTFSCFRYH